MDHAGRRTAATRASRSCSGAAGGRSSGFCARSWRAPSAARRSSASASAHVRPHPTRHGASSRCCSPWTRPSSRCLSATATPVLPASTYAEDTFTFLCFLAICVKPVTWVFIRRHQGSRSSMFEGFWDRLLNKQPLRTRVPAVVVISHWLDFRSRQGLNHTHTEHQTSSGDTVCLHTHIVFCHLSCFCRLNPGSAPMSVVGPAPPAPPRLPPALHPSIPPSLPPFPSPCVIGVC